MRSSARVVTLPFPSLTGSSGEERDYKKCLLPRDFLHCSVLKTEIIEKWAMYNSSEFPTSKEERKELRKKSSQLLLKRYKVKMPQTLPEEEEGPTT